MVYCRLCIGGTNITEDGTVDSTIEALFRSSGYIINLDPCITNIPQMWHESIETVVRTVVINALVGSEHKGVSLSNKDLEPVSGNRVMFNSIGFDDLESYSSILFLH